jgi:hypothetical protein
MKQNPAPAIIIVLIDATRKAGGAPITGPVYPADCSWKVRRMLDRDTPRVFPKFRTDALTLEGVRTFFGVKARII